MDTKHVAALLDALCERPLGDGTDMPSEELQALCRAALARAGDASAGAGSDASEDAERLTAALAALWSSTDRETARRTVETALMASAAARLDAEAARAFLDAIEQSLQTAPAHLVDEVASGGRAAAAGMAQRRLASRWSMIFFRKPVSTFRDHARVHAIGSWSVRRWGLAATCGVLLVAGVSSWSIYRPRSEPPADLAPMQPAAIESSAPAAESRSSTPAAPVNAAVPAPPPAAAPAPAPALAAAEPCEPRRADGSGVDTVAARQPRQQGRTAGEADKRIAAVEKSKREAPPADAPDCAPASGAGAGVEARKARAKAAAEEAAAARAPAKPGLAAPAASRVAPAEPPPAPPALGVR